MCNALDNAKCCTFFSIPAVIFLTIIGLLLDYQPLYIQGPDDYTQAKNGCYNAAILYAVTFVISLSYWTYSNIKNNLPTPLSNCFLSSNEYDRVQ